MTGPTQHAGAVGPDAGPDTGVDLTHVPTEVLTAALVERKEPLGLSWRMRPATVVSSSGPDAVVTLDGDSVGARAISLVGTLADGERVMCVLIPPSGNFVIGTVGDKQTLTVPGDVDYSSSDTGWTAYVPTITGHGSATFTVLSGRWRYVAPKTVVLGIFVSVNLAGSGASNVTLTAPTDIRRTIRQVIPGSSESPTTELAMLAFTGGTGTTFDRIREVSATVTGNLTGADLTAGRLLTFTGVYEEAT